MEMEPRQDIVEFLCPACGRKVRAYTAQAGKGVRCPGCGARAEIPRRPQNRASELVLAALMGWTLLHVILWSAADRPFRVSSVRGGWSDGRYYQPGYEDSGFWPLPGGRMYTGAREATRLPAFSLKTYDITEFLVYVGGAWLSFGAYILLGMHTQGPASCNAPAQAGMIGRALRSMRDGRVIVLSWGLVCLLMAGAAVSLEIPRVLETRAKAREEAREKAEAEAADAHFRMVRKGMTRDEVRRILGEPTRIRPAGSESYEWWHYYWKGVRVYYTFDEGGRLKY